MGHFALDLAREHFDFSVALCTTSRGVIRGRPSAGNFRHLMGQKWQSDLDNNEPRLACLENTAVGETVSPLKFRFLVLLPVWVLVLSDWISSSPFLLKGRKWDQSIETTLISRDFLAKCF